MLPITNNDTAANEIDIYRASECIRTHKHVSHNVSNMNPLRSLYVCACCIRCFVCNTCSGKNDRIQLYECTLILIYTPIYIYLYTPIFQLDSIFSHHVVPILGFDFFWWRLYCLQWGTTMWDGGWSLMYERKRTRANKIRPLYTDSFMWTKQFMLLRENDIYSVWHSPYRLEIACLFIIWLCVCVSCGWVLYTCLYWFLHIFHLPVDSMIEIYWNLENIYVLNQPSNRNRLTTRKSDVSIFLSMRISTFWKPCPAVHPHWHLVLFVRWRPRNESFSVHRDFSHEKNKIEENSFFYQRHCFQLVGKETTSMIKERPSQYKSMEWGWISCEKYIEIDCMRSHSPAVW